MEQSDREGREKIIVQVDPDLEELMPRYFENRRKDILAIDSALKAGDYETIRALGHSMKGSGGGYGLDAITEFGMLIEQAANKGDSAGVAEALARLSDYLLRVEVVYG